MKNRFVFIFSIFQFSYCQWDFNIMNVNAFVVTGSRFGISPLSGKTLGPLGLSLISVNAKATL